MFIRFEQDTLEYLLYDFNLSLGDSLPITYNNLDPAVIVTGIDSFYTPYGYRKRFELAGNTWSSHLIEGVGHSRGLIETMQTPLECGFTLECYSLNDSAYYPVAGPTCFIPVGEADLINSFTLNLYPNPFSNQTTLQTSQHLINASIIIINLMGQTVYEMRSVNGISISLNRKNLPEGLYFLQVHQGNKIISTKKIIISD